jgi:hypothetical protein
MTTVSGGTHTEPIDVSKIRLRVPDPEKGRYCTTCKDWLPVENFPSGKRRYCCKLHRWERFGKQAKRKHMANTENKMLFALWIKAYSDSKLFNSVWDDALIKQGSPYTIARVNISHKQIKQLLQYMVNTFRITSAACAMYHDPVDIGKSTAIVPISPNKLVSLSNAVLVPSTMKRNLFKAFRLDGIDGYTQALHIAEARTNIVFRPSAEQLCEMQDTIFSDRETLLPEF